MSRDAQVEELKKTVVALALVVAELKTRVSQLERNQPVNLADAHATAILKDAGIFPERA